MASSVINAGVRINTFTNTKGVKDFTSSIRNMRLDMLGFEQVASIFRNFGQVVLQASSLGARGIGTLAKAAIELDDVMTQVAAIGSGRLTQSVSSMREEFLKLSNDLPLSATQLGDVAVEAVRAGVSSQKALNAIALTSGKLAAIGDDLTEKAAAKQMVTIANNFGIATKDMAGNTSKLGDMLSKLDDQGIGTAGQIAEIATRASGAARTLRLTQTELLALGTAARNTGSSTEVAGTAISALLNRMAAGTEKFAAASGVSAEKMQGLINSGQSLKALRLFLARLSKDAEGNRRKTTDMAEAMKKAGLGGRRLGNTVALLSSNLGALDKALAAANSATGALDNKFEIFAGSTQKTIDTFKGSMENLAASFGQTLKPVIVGTINVLLPVIDLLQRLPAPVKFTMLVVASAAVAFTALAGALSAVVAALAITATSAVFLIKVFLESRSAAKKFSVTVKGTTRRLKELVKVQRELGLLGVSGAFTLGGSAEVRKLGLLEKESRLKKALGKTNKGAFGADITRIAALLSGNKALIKQYTNLSDAATDSASRFRKGPGAFFRNAVPALSKFGKAVDKNVTGKLRGAAATAGAAVGKTGIGGALSGVLGGAGAAAGAAARTLLPASVTAGAAGAGAAITAAFAGVGTALAPVAAVVGSILIPFIALIALKDDIEGVFSGLLSVFTPFTDALGKIGKMLKDAFGGGSAITGALTVVRLIFIKWVVAMKVAEFALRAIGAGLQGLLAVGLEALKPVIAVIGRLVLGFKRIFANIATVTRAFFGLKKGGDVMAAIFDSMKEGVMNFLAPARFALRILTIGFEGLAGFLFGIVEGLLVAFHPITQELLFLKKEFFELFDGIGKDLAPLKKAFTDIGAAFGFGGKEGIDFMGMMAQAASFLVRGVVAMSPIFILLRVGAKALRVVVSLGKKLFNGFGKRFAPQIRKVGMWLKNVAQIFMFLKETSLQYQHGLKLLGDDIAAMWARLVDNKVVKFLEKTKDLLVEIANLQAGPPTTKGKPAPTVGDSAITGLLSSSIPVPLQIAGKILGLSSGGITPATNRPTPAILHPNEAVIPLKRLPEFAPKFAPAVAKTEAQNSQDIGGSLTITVPVTLMLGDEVIGEAIASVSEDEIRRQLGSRSIRLSGIG